MSRLASFDSQVPLRNVRSTSFDSYATLHKLRFASYSSQVTLRLSAARQTLRLLLHLLRGLFFSGNLERGLVNGELDGVRLGSGAEVVHAGLQALLPRVEVHRRQLAEGSLRHVDVHRLRLADVRSPVGRLAV